MINQISITRKSVDIKYWCIIVEIYKRGYHLTSAGLNIINLIRNHINRKRYSDHTNFKNLNYQHLDSQMITIFDTIAPFSLNSTLTANERAQSIGKRPIETTVHDTWNNTYKDFKSLNNAAIECNLSLREVTKYRNSERLVNNRYLITTKVKLFDLIEG